MNIPNPTPEFPTQEQLRAYGDLAFLYLRSEMHRDVPLHLARLAIQPAIDLSFYKVFHNDGIPRYGVTWAFLSPEAEAKVARGELLQPSEWMSGDQMWVMEIIAPYGQGTAAAVVKWLKQNLPEKVSSVRYQRVDPKSGVVKVLEVTRMRGTQWGTRIVPPETFELPEQNREQ